METNKYHDKGYWDMVRISNEDTEYPANMDKNGVTRKKYYY